MRVVNHWALAKTKWREEERAASHVERQGIAHWLPRMLEWSARGVERRVLMFPGYLFFQVCAGWQSVCSTKGVASVVLCQDRPARVRWDELSYLMGLEDKRGLVVLPSRFADGDSVRVVDGPFRGVVGMVSGATVAGRLSVLWSMLGNQVSLQVGEGSLESI